MHCSRRAGAERKALSPSSHSFGRGRGGEREGGWKRRIEREGKGEGRGNFALLVGARASLSDIKLFKVVLQMSTPPQIHQLILYYYYCKE